MTDKEGRKKEYEDYLKSKEWKEIRIDLITNRGSKCEECGKGGLLDVHHLTYKNIFHEEPGDLMLLCRSCHENIHKRKFKKPEKKTKKSGRKHKWSPADTANTIKKRIERWNISLERIEKRKERNYYKSVESYENAKRSVNTKIINLQKRLKYDKKIGSTSSSVIRWIENLKTN